jgi:hypothetical protein
VKLVSWLLSLAGTVILIGCGATPTTSTSTSGSGPGGGGGQSTHSVDLSWTITESVQISGYNVYRAEYSNACGQLSKINSDLLTDRRYTDSEVTNGTSYCYATTAVTTDNIESGYSNVVYDVRVPAS